PDPRAAMPVATMAEDRNSRRFSMAALLMVLSSRQAIRDQIGAIAVAGRQHDILLAIQHVGDGRAGLDLLHEYGALLLTRLLVISTQPRRLAALLIGEDAGIAADHQGLGGQGAKNARLAGARNLHALQPRMVLDEVRR